MGSGKLLKRAINKRGIEHFTKIILFVFQTEQEMNAKEKELVTEEFLKRKDVYNLCAGGQGGFGYINETGLNVNHKNRHKSIEAFVRAGEAGRKRHIKKIKTDLIYREQFCKNMAAISKQSHKDGKSSTKQLNTPAAIIKRKETYRVRGPQKGDKNSQFGRHWYHNRDLKQSKPFHTNPGFGWEKGRVLKWDAEKEASENKQNRRNTHIRQTEIKDLANKIEAENLYSLYKRLEYTSIRRFVRDGHFNKSHVTLTALWKKYIQK